MTGVEMGTDRPKGGMEQTGPCGTPLTPEGIAAFAGETYTPQFGPTERGWRHCHLKNLITDYGERLVAATARRCAEISDGHVKEGGCLHAGDMIRSEFGLDPAGADKEGGR